LIFIIYLALNVNKNLLNHPETKVMAPPITGDHKKGCLFWHPFRNSEGIVKSLGLGFHPFQKDPDHSLSEFYGTRRAGRSHCPGT